jgi:hypothetical protein
MLWKKIEELLSRKRLASKSLSFAMHTYSRRSAVRRIFLHYLYIYIFIIDKGRGNEETRRKSAGIFFLKT